MNLIIDDGSNYIKIVWMNESGEVQKEVFPSRVTNQPLLTLDGKYDSHTYQVNGQIYSYVAEGRETVQTNNTQYQLSPANRVLIHHAMRQVSQDEANNLILTLPVGQYYREDGTKNTDLIDQKIANAKGAIEYLDGSPVVGIDRVLVVPEGIPAFSHAHDELALQGNTFIIVEVGGTTTEVIEFNQRRITNKVSLDIGAIEYVQEMKAQIALIAGHDKKDIPDHHAQIALQTGKILNFDLSESAASIRRKFTRRVMAAASTFSNASYIDHVIYSGGGAAMLEGVTKTDNPQFDNALGCLPWLALLSEADT